MYLSKISIVPSAQSAAELCRLSRNGTYASHQLLWNLFAAEKQRTFLYREEQQVGGMPLYYVLSHTQPDAELTFFDIQSKEFQPKLVNGLRLAFKLRVNPTICLTDDAGKKKRHDVLMHAKHQAKLDGGCSAAEIKALQDQAALRWISDEKRLSLWGMTLDFLPEIERYTQYSSRKKNGNHVQFSSVDYQGMMTVSDPEVFWQKYGQGFGRAKAMGCGLMLIRPV